MNKDYYPCEYCGCDEEGTVFIEELQVWVCGKHENSVDDSTGYCPVDCQLGYGCDQSC
jgi:hypothetical protein